ncbi:MAG: methyltransferase domain-containing protein [Rhizobiales bacterium]|nr:methyltransferase domain-containing protein [Hyphomicrobiales bacterium]MBI3674855.1 methyltransferase domain-containing protein [Hyphomicrobiales bacterium]
MSKPNPIIFTHYDIEWCLYDQDRLNQYRAAIFKKCKGKVVVDIGSGTGIQALFAAQAGAARVYAIEINPRAAGIIAHNARRNGFEDVIKVIQGDGMEVDVPEKADVVTCDLLCCGLFFEPEIQVLNNAKRYLKPGGQFIPEEVESRVELIAAETHTYGLRLDYINRSTELPGDRPLTDAAIYNRSRFADDLSGWIDGDVVLTATQTGVANAIRTSGRALLAPGIYTGRTVSLFNPETVFLKEPIPVSKGQQYRMKLHYLGGGDPLEANIAVAEVAAMAPAAE